MRRIVFAMLLVLHFCGGEAMAQNLRSPLLDAQTLKQEIDSFNMAGISDVTKVNLSMEMLSLINFYIKDGQAESYGELLKKIADDTLLVHNLPTLDRVPQAIVAGKPDTSNHDIIPGQGNSQGAGLPSATTLIDGLSTFIARRFKQELEMAYLNKFKTELNNNPVLSNLLPSTLKILNQNDVFQYTTFLEALKEALEKDLKALPGNFGQFMAQDPLHLAGQTSSYYPLVLAYNNMIQIIMNGKNVTQVLSALDQDPLMPKVEQPYSSLLSLTAIVSRSLQNPVTPDGNPGWMVLSNVQSILAVPMQQQLFIGLVMVREKAVLKTQIKFDGVDLYTLINRHWRRIDSLTNWIGESVSAYQAILADVKKLNDFRRASPPGTLPTSELIATYSRDIVQVLTVVYDFPLIDRNALIARFPALPKVFLAMNSWVQVSAEIASENYGLALSDVVDVLQLLINDPKVVAAVNKYGGFAVSIAKAKSAQDFDKALEAAALPVGSYQIKRSSYKNISLNAYAGLFGAWQHYPGDLPAGVERDNRLIGFTAPVGVAYSWGSYYHSGKKKDSLQGSSNTIFLSVLDVGAITSFRLTHDSTATLPDFKWNNVLAPGLFYIYGFRRSPLSLGGGVQYGPQLRSITNNAAVVLPSAITYRLFLVVDIPLFDFYTRRETN